MVWWRYRTTVFQIARAFSWSLMPGLMYVLAQASGLDTSSDLSDSTNRWLTMPGVPAGGLRRRGRQEEAGEEAGDTDRKDAGADRQMSAAGHWGHQKGGGGWRIGSLILAGHPPSVPGFAVNASAFWRESDGPADVGDGASQRPPSPRRRDLLPPPLFSLSRCGRRPILRSYHQTAGLQDATDMTTPVVLETSLPGLPVRGQGSRRVRPRRPAPAG